MNALQYNEQVDSTGPATMLLVYFFLQIHIEKNDNVHLTEFSHRTHLHVTSPI